MGLYALGLGVFTGAANAAPHIEEQQPLDFGTLAIPANDRISRLVLPRSGRGVNIEGHFVLVEPGRPGRYQLSGFPAHTPLEISVEDAELTAAGGGLSEPLYAGSFDAGSVTTGATGSVELTLGATLSTSGNHAGHADAPYQGSATLRVDYWHPQAKDYVFNVFDIDLRATLRTTLMLHEVEPLNFGTFFAKSSADEQARLHLQPDGRFSIDSPGETRLVPIVHPQPAILQVSGAAASYPLQIIPQNGPVFLLHTTRPTGPRLILEPLITAPAETGITSREGTLTIRVGGTLSTELTDVPQVYPPGSYQGSYEMTVTY